MRFSRFVNIVTASREKAETIWNVLKLIKAKHIFKRCRKGDIVEDRDIKSQISAIRQELKINSSKIITESEIESNLKEAGPMFIYIIACDHTNKRWFLFIKEVFENYTLSQIILTMNRFIKNSEIKPIDDQFNKEVQENMRELLKYFKAAYSLEFTRPQSFIFNASAGNVPESDLEEMKGRYTNIWP